MPRIGRLNFDPYTLSKRQIDTMDARNAYKHALVDWIMNSPLTFEPQTDNGQQIFDVFAEIAKLPDTSGTMLQDVYFSDVETASSRIFRIYRSLPLHYHEDCDEHLFVVSGEAIFHLNGNESLAKPGMFVRFPRKQVHGFPKVLAHSFVILAIDVPRRRPDDIVFVNPEDGDAKSFMGRNAR